jgi:orotate phosphoribosyltransferase
MTSAQHARLVELIKELAVVHGRVTLSSGIEADYYVDLRRATLHHEAAPLIGQVMLDMLDAAGITDFDAAGGLTKAAARGRKLDAFVVRKAAKAHGMGRQVEGPSVDGKRVIVVEDTSTTGGSPLTAAKALEEAGAIIVAVATVVDRDTGAQKVIEDAGYRYLSAVSLDDLGLR